MPAQSLYDKIWQAHLVSEGDDGVALIYIDLHLLHEVTSPQAFAGLRQTGRRPWRPGANLATPDHNVPTTNRAQGIAGIQDPDSRIQVRTLDANCTLFQIPAFALDDIRQGIVHVVGPEQGATMPGMTIVCGDSHTSTHGAFAVLAQGIGTSEVEHVLTTQCLRQRKTATMRVRFDNQPGPGITAKDMALALIGQIGVAGGTGYTIEYAGSAVRALSMESRMALCNMSIEAGARAGMVAVDDRTLHYLEHRPFAPAGRLRERALATWQDLVSDADAVFANEVELRVDTLEPQVTWGTSPAMVIGIGGRIPDPSARPPGTDRDDLARALEYMGLTPGQAIADTPIDRVFIGSCTNSRIEDLRAAAAVMSGRKVAATVKQAMVVPGSGLVKRQAEKEGLDQIFSKAGFEWRDPGCSMCLGMNADKLGMRERCASTSNRNFEGRQGHGGRTHLVSPIMAAAAAVQGGLVDVRELLRD